jgi:hypothetical protein
MAAAGGDDAWSRSKAALARLYASQVLSLAPAAADAFADGADDLAATPAEALS